MKARGIDEFSERLDEIFEQGIPTKAQIIDAYNKFSTQIELLNEIIENQHKLMVNAEQRGYDKAMEEFHTQFKTNSKEYPVNEKIFILDLLKLNKSEKMYSEESVINIIKQVLQFKVTDWRKELKVFNDFMCSNQYDGRIPLIETCIDEYLSTRPDNKINESKDDSYNLSLCKCKHPKFLYGVCKKCGKFKD